MTLLIYLVRFLCELFSHVLIDYFTVYIFKGDNNSAV